jgi:hypothetical protein
LVVTYDIIFTTRGALIFLLLVLRREVAHTR